MRRPYVEPGHRSARPGIRHRSRSNGPDRKGRDPTTLAPSSRSNRLTSEGETDQDDFYSDNDDQGFVTQTDENAVTAAEDIDGEEELEDDDLLDEDDDREVARSERSIGRPAPAIRGAGTTTRSPLLDEQSDDEDGDDDDDERNVRTPRNQSRSNLAATPRSRPRSYSRSNKLAPEEEDWALKDEAKRRKGGVFGRLKRLGRKPKDSNNDAGQPREGANADVVLGRSYGAVRELRSRKSSIRKPESADPVAPVIELSSAGALQLLPSRPVSLAASTALPVVEATPATRDVEASMTTLTASLATHGQVLRFVLVSLLRSLPAMTVPTLVGKRLFWQVFLGPVLLHQLRCAMQRTLARLRSSRLPAPTPTLDRSRWPRAFSQVCSTPATLLP